MTSAFPTTRGLGRCLIKNDSTSLLARSGAGLSHEIGSPQ